MPVLALSALVGLVLLARSGAPAGIVYSIDESYFVAAGRRLSWGYADQPPLTPLLAHLMDTVFPGSSVGLRLPATLLTAAGVAIAALITRELGGGRRAQMIAASGYALAMLPWGQILYPATLDVFFWTLLSWLLVRWVRLHDQGRRHDGLLLAAGVVTALSLQTKYLVPALWTVLTLSVLVVGPRQMLFRPALWVGGAVAALSAVPGLLWQSRHGWPQIEMGQVISAQGRTDVLGALLAAGLPAGVLLLGYGLWHLLRSPQLRAYRFLGWAVIGLLAVFVIAGGRDYYALGIYPVCFAAGAVELERRRSACWRGWLVIWPVVAASAVGVGLSLLPGSPAESDHREQADRVATAYRSLPPDTRGEVAILTEAYTQAGYLERFGPQRGLPRSVYSPNRGFWHFGAPPETSEAALYVSGNEPGRLENLRRHFTRAEQLVAGEENSGVGAVWLLDGRRAPWSEIWPEVYYL
ncbi:ArnT family glycosyltransferase [Pseudonocardia sp. H11422]|uniref:ArnT family glycosyltransferase n=1 Tax=Pseudonocardia sp. H11422 TaxID=2835866 RepID=UPI0027E2F283|nr:glycosyltransferase family 39 protein [Pseudonocardia sp. H11422]